MYVYHGDVHDKSNRRKKDSVRSYYEKNEDSFKGKFSRSSLNRVWNSSGVKDLYNSIPLDESMDSHKDKVIEMLSPHLNFMTDNKFSLGHLKKFSKEEEERIMDLNMKKRFLTNEEEK